jgi:hypothetical protein
VLLIVPELLPPILVIADPVCKLVALKPDILYGILKLKPVAPEAPDPAASLRVTLIVVVCPTSIVALSIVITGDAKHIPDEKKATTTIRLKYKYNFLILNPSAF